MTFMNSCLCFSLLASSIIIGIAAAFLYCVAFALELWMILETDVSLMIIIVIIIIIIIIIR